MVVYSSEHLGKDYNLSHLKVSDSYKALVGLDIEIVVLCLQQREYLREVYFLHKLEALSSQPAFKPLL